MFLHALCPRKVLEPCRNYSRLNATVFFPKFCSCQGVRSGFFTIQVTFLSNLPRLPISSCSPGVPSNSKRKNFSSSTTQGETRSSAREMWLRLSAAKNLAVQSVIIFQNMAWFTQYSTEVQNYCIPSRDFLHQMNIPRL